MYDRTKEKNEKTLASEQNKNANGDMKKGEPRTQMYAKSTLSKSYKAQTYTFLFYYYYYWN